MTSIELSAKGASPAGSKHLLAVLLVAALCVWFLWPALFSVHPESFSARLESQAIMGMRGKLALDDQAYPINTQYLYGTRPGTVIALEWLMRLTGTHGNISFRLLVLGSYLIFVTACFLFAKRWGQASFLAACVALMLTPGLVEISFYFADNLPSAAMICLALALVAEQTPRWRWILIGVLFALAVLFRVDALIALPSIAVVAALRARWDLGRAVLDAFLFAAAAAATFVLGAKITGVSLLQSLQIGTFFAHVHLGETSAYRNLRDTAEMFFGLPSLVLIAVGTWQNWRTRSLKWNLCLTVYPAVIYVYYAAKAIELRDFLLLGAPFLVLQGATGAGKLWTWMLTGTGRQKAFLATVSAVCAVVLLVPPYIHYKDGPRAVLGRFWSTLYWRAWQRDVAANMAECDHLIDSTKPGERILVVSVMWNADRYFHLRLLQHGYSIQPSATPTPFGEADEVAQKDGRTFVLVRTENAYDLLSAPPFHEPEGYAQSFQLAHALAKLTPLGFNRAYMLTWGGPDQQKFIAGSAPFQQVSRPLEYPLPPRFGFPHQHVNDGRLRVTPLTPQDLSSLQTYAENQVQAAEAGSHGQWKYLQSFDQIHSALTAPGWKP